MNEGKQETFERVNDYLFIGLCYNSIFDPQFQKKNSRNKKIFSMHFNHLHLFLNFKRLFKKLKFKNMLSTRYNH